MVSCKEISAANFVSQALDSAKRTSILLACKPREIGRRKFEGKQSGEELEASFGDKILELVTFTGAGGP